MCTLGTTLDSLQKTNVMLTPAPPMNLSTIWDLKQARSIIEREENYFCSRSLMGIAVPINMHAMGSHILDVPVVLGVPQRFDIRRNTAS